LAEQDLIRRSGAGGNKFILKGWSGSKVVTVNKKNSLVTYLR